MTGSPKGKVPSRRTRPLTSRPVLPPVVFCNKDYPSMPQTQSRRHSAVQYPLESYLREINETLILSTGASISRENAEQFREY